MKSVTFVCLLLMSTVCIYSDEDIGVCFVVPGPGSCYKESNIMETKIRYSTVLGRCISFLRSPCPGDDNRNVFNDEDSCMKACENVGKV